MGGRRGVVPLWLAASVTAGSAIAGTLCGLLAQHTITGGMFGFFLRRGWPFAWLQRGAVADSPELARRAALDASWTVSGFALGASLVFWACIGLIVLMAALLVAGRVRR